MGKAFLDIQGTPGLISVGTDGLSVGAVGTGNYKEFTAGGKQTPLSSPAEGVAAAALASSGTIAPTSYWQRVLTAGAVTGIILAAGTLHGQRLLLTVDKDSVGSVTFAAAGTSRVGLGVGLVITAGSSRELIWDNTDLIWSVIGAS